MLREDAAAAANVGADRSTVPIQAWSPAYGLAMLIFDDRLDPDEDAVDRVFVIRL